MGYFKKFNAGEGIPFMDGRTHGDMSELAGADLHFSDFGFINGQDGEYAVMAFTEQPEKFYFGNSIITENLREIEKDGMKTELLGGNVSVKFTQKKSKNNRTYWAVEFNEVSENIPF